MIIGSALLFFFALFGLLGLFGAKYWEMRAEDESLVQWRLRADARAAQLKSVLARSRHEIRSYTPKIALWCRYMVHESALKAAASARYMEQLAHSLADVVSHKHHFEFRETRSDYLKRVSEYKNTVRGK